jgi:hypothetical protein
MSVERGPCQIMLKTDFGRFLAKLLIFPNFQYTIGKVLKNDLKNDDSQRLSRYGGFSFEKRRFSTVNISKKEAHFDPRPSPGQKFFKFPMSWHDF